MHRPTTPSPTPSRRRLQQHGASDPFLGAAASSGGHSPLQDTQYPEVFASASLEYLGDALEHNPRLIRDELDLALGADGLEPTWMRRESSDGESARSLRALSFHGLPDNYPEAYSTRNSMFQTPRRGDATYDIPMITLDTLAARLADADLELGLCTRPPVTPHLAQSHLAPGLPSKFANIISRISDRIAGSNHPPSPTPEHPPAFERPHSPSVQVSYFDDISSATTPVDSVSSGVHSPRVLPMLGPAELLCSQRSTLPSHATPNASHLDVSTGASVRPLASRHSAETVSVHGDPRPKFDYLYLYGRSLKVFLPELPLRIRCHRIVSYPRVNTVIVSLIILQTCVLANRQWDPQTLGYVVLGNNWQDYLVMAINIVYTVEIAAKIIAYGFYDDRVMFDDLGLGYPSGLFSSMGRYFGDTVVRSFFGWLPRVKAKIHAHSAWSHHMAPESLQDKKPGTVDPVELGPFDDSHRILSSPPAAPPLRRLNKYNTFVQTTNIEKKVDEMNLHRAYLRNNWQVVDFISMVCFWISLLFSIDHYDAKHHFLVFRALSCLRILRLLNLTQGTSIILRACESAIPQLIDVGLVIVCFWVIFGIIGVQSFKSSLARHCEWTNPLDSSDTYINTDSYCGSYIDLAGNAASYLLRSGESSGFIKGYRCPQNSVCRSGDNPYGGTVNFDNILQSMQMVFVLISVNAFSDIMYYLMDTDSIASSLFFIFGIFILTVWLMNIFIAIIVTSFKIVQMEEAEEKKRRTEPKKLFLGFWQFNDELHGKKVRDLILQKRFLRYYYKSEFLFIMLILADIIVQGLRSYGMDESLAHALYRWELVFTGLLVIEIVLRFILYLPHWRTFFLSRRNCFDLFLAVFTGIIIIGPVKDKLGHAYYWLTVFQLARFYRVALSFKITSDLWFKIMRNFKSIYDLTLFYFILLCLSSIILARYFEGTIPSDEIDNVELAMHTLPNAAMSLYVVTSTENWASVMYNLAEYSSTTFQRSFGSILIIVWFVVSNLVVMNIFIAVIAKALEVSEEGRRKHQLRKFIDDMTERLQAVRVRPGVFHKLKLKIFKSTEDRNIEKAVTNLLLSGSAVNEFIDGDEEELDVDDDTHHVRQNAIKRWLKAKHIAVKEHFDNPFRDQKKLVTNVENFEPAKFATQVITERKNLIKKQDQYLKDNPNYNTVFYMLGPRHRLRRICQRIVPSSHGERIDGVEPKKTLGDIFSMLMFASTVGIVVTACYLTPLYRREVIEKYGQWNWTFYIDVFFLAVFTVELLIKTTADGLISTPNAYIRSPWNWLDFTALLSLWIEFVAFIRNDGNMSRVVRGLKALRALRILTISETAKNNFNFTMISGFGKIMDAATISLTLLIPFSIWALNVFNGRLGYCIDGSSPQSLCYNEYQNTVFNWDIMSPNVYENPYLHMDDFPSSFSSLYQIVSLEGWVDLLMNVMQSTGIGTPQQMFASPINGIFIIVFNFVSSVFILTLFVSVIISNYSKVTGRAYLTPKQIQWYHVKNFLMQVKPSKRRDLSSVNKYRRFCYNMTVGRNEIWGGILNTVLVLHVLALVLEAFPLVVPNGARSGLFVASTSCFLIHHVMLMSAQGWKVFISNKWNMFSVFVAIGAWVTTIIGLKVNSGSVFGNFNKLFLTGFLIFLFPRSDRLSQLLRFASASFPSLFSLMFTWFVIFLVYAIAMNQVFGMTKIGPNTTGNINLRSVPKALILLFRCSLGEGWNYIMDDFALEAPFCTSDVSIDDSDCGSTEYAYILFMSWNVISMYIMLNLFVSLILDSFSYIAGGTEYAHLISRAEIRNFKRKWQKFDPEGTGFIDPKDLSKFLHTLDGALSFHFYTGALSIPDLCSKWIIRNNPHDPYDVDINHDAMNSIMAVMDIPKIRERRRLYEQFMEEAVMTMELHEEPGISFSRLMVQIPLYNSFDPSQCLILIDFLERRLFYQKLAKRLRTKRCYELIEGYVCRWKYARHMRRGGPINPEDLTVGDRHYEYSSDESFKERDLL